MPVTHVLFSTPTANVAILPVYTAARNIAERFGLDVATVEAELVAGVTFSLGGFTFTPERRTSVAS